jgi:hypothetical protein
MSENEQTRPDRILRISALIGGLAFIAAYLFVALSRIGYPFELEWMEGGSVERVRRMPTRAGGWFASYPKCGGTS